MPINCNMQKCEQLVLFVCLMLMIDKSDSQTRMRKNCSNQNNNKADNRGWRRVSAESREGILPWSEYIVQAIIVNRWHNTYWKTEPLSSRIFYVTARHSILYGMHMYIVHQRVCVLHYILCAIHVRCIQQNAQKKNNDPRRRRMMDAEGKRVLSAAKKTQNQRQSKLKRVIKGKCFKCKNPFDAY